MILSKWDTIVKAPTATDRSTENTDHRQDGNDQSLCEENTRHSREDSPHGSSQSRTDTSHTATSTQSEYIGTSPSQSPYSSFDLNIAQAKHNLMVTLMKDVYAMFDSKWEGSVRTCATSGEQSSGGRAQSSKVETTRVAKGSKKRMKDRDSSPPGRGNGKREKKDDPDIGLHDQSRLLACPFHKHDPSKYCLNGDTGATYRSCPGPGFMCISHLK